MNTVTALQTARLYLRPFSENDLDDLAPLMANPDFMRFASGVYSREQTADFLEKVGKRDREGLPSQFAVILLSEARLIGYCGFFLQIVDGVEELEIGYRLDPQSGAVVLPPKRRRRSAIMLSTNWNSRA
jgi:RimJ/RimL family protein N-acetyltransferase